MPSEVRTIMFTQDEVLEALRGYRLRKGQPIIHGDLFKMKLEDDDGVSAAIAIHAKGEDRLEQYTFSAQELGAALVMHCIKSKIPLPANGATKALQVAGDSLALVVTMGATAQLGNYTKVV